MGLPVIISDHTGMSDLIDGRAGIVVDLSSATLAQELKKLLASSELQRKFSEGGKQLISEHFSETVVASKLQELY